MKRALAVIVLILTFTLGLFAGQEKAVYKILRFSTNEVGIFCTNGGDPAVKGNPTGHVLEVSCGI